MNFLMQKNDDRINAAVPAEMRRLLREIATRMNMNESAYIKIALQNQLNNDMAARRFLGVENAQTANQ
jgi:hypothetical protein